MTSFTWLHLTDLHWGMTGLHRLWPRMEEKFFGDLTTLHNKTGPWDLVLFTGDLTYRAAPDEFEKVDNLLGKLWEHLSKLGSKPGLLAVPGNHDLTRPKDPYQTELLVLKNEWANPRVAAHFWDTPEWSCRTVVEEAFGNYVTWWDKQPLKLKGVRAGMLPGDFSATLQKGSAKLGILGLNTAFLQLSDDDYQGKLALNADQFHRVCGGDSGPEWAKSHHACLLLTHHPREWLTPDSQKEFNEEIADPGQFAAHLFGHLHEARYSRFSEAGNEPRFFWQGRSLFGLENYVDKTGADAVRKHGYSVGKLHLKDNGTALLTFWPRAARLQGDAWGMVRDDDYKLTEEGGNTEPAPVRLLRAFGKGPTSDPDVIFVVLQEGESLIQSTRSWDGREVSIRPLEKEK